MKKSLDDFARLNICIGALLEIIAIIQNGSLPLADKDTMHNCLEKINTITQVALKRLERE